MFRIFALGVMVASALFFLFALERFFAAVANLYKFHFAWPAPIYLIPSTFTLFCGALLGLITVTFWLKKLMFKEAYRSTRMLSASMWVNVVTVGLLVLMVGARLVIFSD
ncbi:MULTISPECIES: hypothetical protein [unclassified Polaromonas]|uniref:hypothetical protein n=1 Tax=unclassified Polaromonas TaxID=2638319 RepID=UPI000F0890AE|nr:MULTISPECIES: hypothetical protein [unclassified Polaromonas]AYQ29871.1 hypothetical protein DT070_18720 [Polaromonas sp. SP1]QGJ19014.1 hypothetical protein F7R28_11860 [Polaromonas sp. Pch-P]